MEENLSVCLMMVEVWLSFKPVDQYLANNGDYTEVEYSLKFLKSMFHLIRIEDFETI